jgi:glycosyltransferase involved in cell wall biosynthesis
MRKPTIHVLYVIDSLCGWAGAESALLRMTRYLPTDRYRCTVVTFRTHPHFNGWNQFPCNVRLFPMRRTYGWEAFRTALKLRQIIRKQHVSIVHTFFETSDLWGGLVARLSGCPVVISSRRDMGIQRSRLHKIAYRLMPWIFDQVQTVSEAVRQFCIRTDRQQPEKVVTVHNGIDAKRIAGDAEVTREQLGLPGTSRLVAMVGNVKPVKAIEVVLQSAAIVCREVPDTVFLIIGGIHHPQYFEEMQALAKSLGLEDNVRFLTKTKDVAPVLRICDAFCLLSRSEGFSNALVEAMACRLPCVVTRVGGNEEIVQEGRTGFVVPTEDAAAAAAKLLVLLRDLRRAREMGEAGEQLVRSQFTAQTMVKAIVAQYDRLLEMKAANRVAARIDGGLLQSADACRQRPS